MPKREQPAPTRPDMLGGLVQKLAGQVRTLHLFVDVQEEDGTITQTYVLDVVHHDGTRAGVVRSCLAEAFQAVLERRPRGRQCRVCGEVKAIWEYAKSKTANTKDGRLPRCKVCERLRVQKYRPSRSTTVPAHQLN